MIKTTRHVSIGAPASTLDFLKVARQVRYESYETLFSTIGFCNTPRRVRYKTYKTQGATLPELLTFHHGADCCGDGLALVSWLTALHLESTCYATGRKWKQHPNEAGRAIRPNWRRSWRS